jgi:hypothetical protein
MYEQTITDLKTHLKYCKEPKMTTKYWCIHYLMDFLLIDRAEASRILLTEFEQFKRKPHNKREHLTSGKK